MKPAVTSTIFLERINTQDTQGSSAHVLGRLKLRGYEIRQPLLFHEQKGFQFTIIHFPSLKGDRCAGFLQRLASIEKAGL
jgi:hypothetical protein